MADTLLLFSFLLFAISIRSVSTAFNGLGVFLATAAFAWTLALQGRERATSGPNRRGDLRLLVGIFILSFLVVAGWSPSTIGPTSANLERLPGIVWVLFGVGAYFVRRRERIFAPFILTLGVLSFSAAVGVFHIAAADGVGFDVLFLHEETANALVAGQNPYTDVVAVPNGAPTAQPGEVITGYVYPPVTAVVYSLGELAFSDPRYTSLLAWLGVLALIGIDAIKTKRRDRLLVMILLASIPGWPLVLRAAWTEPVSLALIAIGFFYWQRGPVSGSGFGLALASKQYFAVTAPLLLLNRSQNWRARLIVASLIIATTMGMALAWDVRAFWSSAIEFHLTTPPRPDSSNVVGLLASLGVTWDPPPFLALGIGLVTSWLLSVRRQGSLWFLLSLGLALSVSFLITSQAFANYWFLIAGICAIGLSRSSPESEA